MADWMARFYLIKSGTLCKMFGYPYMLCSKGPVQPEEPLLLWGQAPLHKDKRVLLHQQGGDYPQHTVLTFQGVLGVQITKAAAQQVRYQEHKREPWLRPGRKTSILSTAIRRNLPLNSLTRREVKDWNTASGLNINCSGGFLSVGQGDKEQHLQHQSYRPTFSAA